MSESKRKFLIIDGNALLHRAFHALPWLTTKKGKVINAVYGFTSVLIKILKELKPEYVVVAFDLAAPTFRHKEFKAYKAQRVKQPQELYDQIPLVEEVLESFGVPVYTKEGFEADDIIATICEENEKKHKDIENIILTGDLDTLQLVDERTKVLAFRKGISETTLYDRDKIKERFGLRPEQLIDYKALRGDPSDNIPGVRGIGEVTAKELLQKFHSLREVYKNLSELKPKLRETLEKDRETAERAQDLVTLRKDVPVDFGLEETKLKEYNMKKISEVFQKLEFQSLLKRIYESKDNFTPRSSESKGRAQKNNGKNPTGQNSLF